MLWIFNYVRRCPTNFIVGLMYCTCTTCMIAKHQIVVGNLQWQIMSVMQSTSPEEGLNKAKMSTKECAEAQQCAEVASNKIHKTLDNTNTACRHLSDPVLKYNSNGMLWIFKYVRRCPTDFIVGLTFCQIPFKKLKSSLRPINTNWPFS